MAKFLRLRSGTPISRQSRIYSLGHPIPFSGIKPDRPLRRLGLPCRIVAAEIRPLPGQITPGSDVTPSLRQAMSLVQVRPPLDIFRHGAIRAERFSPTVFPWGRVARLLWSKRL